MLYKNIKLERICTDLKEATKYFGGDKKMAESLLIKVSILKKLERIYDVIELSFFRFHKLINKGKYKDLEGYFAIDVKTPKDRWRIILEPLDDNKNPFVPCNIDEISKIVRIIEIKEVSNHYE